MNREKIKTILDKSNQIRLAICGDSLLDGIHYGSIERLNPERAGRPLLRIAKEEYRLGGAANVAANSAALGTSVDLFSVVGDDDKGKILSEYCANQNITLQTVPHGKTLFKLRYLESAHGDYLLRVDYGEEKNLEPITAAQAKVILDLFDKGNYQALMLSDYGKRLFEGEHGIAPDLIERARKKGIPISVDPKPHNILAFRGATVICPNLSEARQITQAGPKESLREIAVRLREIAQCEYAVITCGKEGMVIYDGTTYEVLPTKALEVLDVTGAGDTVAAMLALGMASGLSIREACHLGNYAAGIVCGKEGTATVSREELLAAIPE